jgi:hypothetical protein
MRPVEQGEGDSLVAVFEHASDAVAAALELQRAPLGPIRLRIGVHTGEVQLCDEGNDIGPSALAHTGYDAYAAEVGDDNADGTITEDESGWDCRTMGNRICGPGNVQGAIPGDYTTVHPDGSPAWPTGEYAYDAGAYVGGYN